MAPHRAYRRTCVSARFRRAASRTRSKPRRPPSLALADAAEKYLAELTWRDFATALLDAHPDLATRPLRPEFERFPWRDDEDGLSRLGAWAHRLSDRRRRHAPIVADGIFAQSRAPDRRFVPGQAPAHRLAARRGMVLGHAHRRRSGEQSAQLAMGRRRRRRFRALLPHLQSCAAGGKVRPRRRLCAPMGPGAGASRGARHP